MNIERIIGSDNWFSNKLLLYLYLSPYILCIYILTPRIDLYFSDGDDFPPNLCRGSRLLIHRKENDGNST